MQYTKRYIAQRFSLLFVNQALDYVVQHNTMQYDHRISNINCIYVYKDNYSDDVRAENFDRQHSIVVEIDPTSFCNQTQHRMPTKSTLMQFSIGECCH